MLSDEQIEANVAAIRATLEDLLSDRNDGGPPPLILNNLVNALPRLPCGNQGRIQALSCQSCQELTSVLPLPISECRFGTHKQCLVIHMIRTAEASVRLLTHSQHGRTVLAVGNALRIWFIWCLECLYICCSCCLLAQGLLWYASTRLMCSRRWQDWFGGIGLLSFLRDVGKHARVGTMLSRDSVRSRMEADNEGMSFTECAPRQFLHASKRWGSPWRAGAGAGRKGSY